MSLLAFLLALFAATILPADERSFYMGFTPFPYDVTDEALDWTYATVLEHGDLLAHHLDTGVPWPEALKGPPYPDLVESELEDRVQRTPGSHVIYLAATPLSQFRDGLAAYWSDQGQVPLPGPWARRRFNHPKVVRAYRKYCLNLIKRFDPDYFAYGIEVDLLARNDPQAFEDFKILARKVYRRIKRKHPELPVFLTFTLGLPDEWEEIQAVMQPLLPYTDLLAVSTYPYLVVDWGGDPNRIPDDWLSRIREIDAEKPIAIAETGYAAEPVIFETLGVSIPGRRRWQTRYTRWLLREANALAAEFVVWFFVVDYDRLWELAEEAGVDEVFKAWRDTGFYNQNLKRRPAAKPWDRYLKRTRN